jgi:SAM-dependent methyltransferase
MTTSEREGLARSSKRSGSDAAGAETPARRGHWWRQGQRYAVSERPADIKELPGRLPASVLEYEQLSGHRSLLAEAIFVSLQAFGFYTRHAPRYLEYPWIIERILHASAPGAVLDLGAGVSPVPLILAARDWAVTTVDYSQTIRSVTQPGKLNEWGFLDYKEVDGRIRSVNEDFSKTDFAPDSFDVIYSVSVIEHMPADIRRDVVATASKCLKPGGGLILTLDLEPKTLRLWNRDRGKKVEPTKTHGTLDDFLAEMSSVDLIVEYLEVRRDLPRSRTDIAFLVARKS